MDHFDPYSVLLAIATNIAVLLMTGFIFVCHIFKMLMILQDIVIMNMLVLSSVRMGCSVRSALNCIEHAFAVYFKSKCIFNKSLLQVM